MKKIYSKPSTKAISITVSNFMEESTVVESVNTDVELTDEPAPLF